MEEQSNQGKPQMKVVGPRVVITEMGPVSFFRMCLTLGERYIEQAIAALEMQQQLAPSDTAAEHRYCSETMSKLFPTDAAEWLKQERAKVRAEFWGLISEAKLAYDVYLRDREREGGGSATVMDLHMHNLRKAVRALPLTAAHPELNMLVAMWFERAENASRDSPSTEAAVRTCASELFELLGGGRK